MVSLGARGIAPAAPFDHWQRVTLRRVLRQQLRRDLRRIETNDRKGWRPEPGSLDLTRLELRHINAILDILGFPEDTVPEPKGIQ